MQSAVSRSEHGSGPEFRGGTVAGRKRGRPAFAPTPAQRRRVAIAAGCGMAHEQIAIGLNISRETLEKHFEHELSVGAYERRMEVFEGLHKAAKKGNAAAVKLYAQLNPQIAPPPLERNAPGAEKPEKPLGKKEQAQADAQVAQRGTDWNDLLPGPKAIQ